MFAYSDGACGADGTFLVLLPAALNRQRAAGAPCRRGAQGTQHTLESQCGLCPPAWVRYFAIHQVRSKAKKQELGITAWYFWPDSP